MLLSLQNPVHVMEILLCYTTRTHKGYTIKIRFLKYGPFRLIAIHVYYKKRKHIPVVTVDTYRMHV